MDQFEQIYKDAKGSARVMAISVHPYIMGAPHRVEIFPQDLREDPEEEGRAVLDRRADRGLVQEGRPGRAVVHTPSWPGLSRPSTLFRLLDLSVDARHKPGHDRR